MIRRISYKTTVGLGAVLGITLAGCGGNADNTSTTSPDTSTTAPSATTAPANTATSMGTTSTGTVSTASFKSAAATWSKVMAANGALDKIIKSKNLKTVHEAAFALRDIVKTLPAQSAALASDKQKTLASQVKNVEQIAGMLDESGDANNQKATQENQASMNDTLDIIKGLYPSGALK